MKTRISKKSLSNYPQSVSNRIKELADRFKIKSFNAESVDSDKVFSVAEGSHYYGFGPDNREASFETVAQHNVGSANVSYRIGQQFQMPDNSHLIEIYYYSRYYMSVYKIEPKRITA